MAVGERSVGTYGGSYLESCDRLGVADERFALSGLEGRPRV
jgi:hypothetical protein